MFLFCTFIIFTLSEKLPQFPRRKRPGANQFFAFVFVRRIKNINKVIFYFDSLFYAFIVLLFSASEGAKAYNEANALLDPDERWRVLLECAS